MNYLSVCSGIEAASAAWKNLNWSAVGFSEIEPFPCAVLKHHYSTVNNYGDINGHSEWKLPPINLLVGGTPCQSFSLAGLRKGLEDPRGNLMLTYLRIIESRKPKWIVWENVPGVLSSNGGRDFATFVTALGNMGYGWAYRVLDSQWFGVPQRRKRVFVIGYLGGRNLATEVLFKSESVCRDFEKGKKKGKRITGTAEDSSGVSSTRRPEHTTVGALCADSHPGAYSGQDAYTGRLIATTINPTAYAFDSMSSNSMRSSNPISGCNQVDISKSLDTSRGLDPSCNQGGIGIVQANSYGTDLYNGAITGDIVVPLTNRADGTGTGPTVMQLKNEEVKNELNCIFHTMPLEPKSYGIPGNWIGRKPENGGNSTTPMNDIAPCLTKTDIHGVSYNMKVRRLTPIECERLQGFPDKYTEIPWRGKTSDQCPDGPRYKALGNSMTVPVMRWIGERIAMVDSTSK